MGTEKTVPGIFQLIMQGKNLLTGYWKKITNSVCSNHYPAFIEFRSNGIYEGSAETRGEYTTWDVGTYTLNEDGTVEISTATDKVIKYKALISKSEITFTDSGNCVFKYIKTKES